jgi:hypothetical protein
MSRLEDEQTLMAAFDNYQKVLAKKNQTAHKSVKAHKPIRIPKHSSVTTSFGAKFKVLTCNRFNDDKWLVTGEVYHVDRMNTKDKDKIEAEVDLICRGTIMPKTDFTVTFMPGVQPMPDIEYHNQKVPPPRKAWVEKGLSDSDIVFRDRKFAPPASSDSEVLSTERMQRLHALARRIIDFESYANHLNNQHTNESTSNVNIIEQEFVFQTGSPGRLANDVKASMMETFILRPSLPVKDRAVARPAPFL